MTDETQPASDPSAPTKVPRRGRAGRFLLNVGALTLMLGVGWVAGSNRYDMPDLAQVSSTFMAHAVQTRASVEAALANVVSWAGPRDANAVGVPSTPTSSVGDAEGLSGKLDELRVASERMLEEARRSAERMTSGMESNSQQLAVRFADLSERLDRIERNTPVAAGSVLMKLEQLSDRLDRMERAAAVALKPSQPAALPSSAVPAAKSATAAGEAPPPAAAASNVQSAESKKIPDWIVRDVIDGKAILQGPKGVVGVVPGDLIPGVGRVQSIARQGGRWTVATTNGLISAR